MRKFLSDIKQSFVSEARIVLHDFSIFLVASAAILIYGMIYTYAYSPEVLEQVPAVVVDMDNSSKSREFIRAIEASPAIEIVSRASNLATAKGELLEREAYAILYIQKDFQKNLLTNQTAYFSSYSDASYFLAYKQFFMATNAVMMDFNKQIKLQRYELGGASAPQAQFLSQPVGYSSSFLYNHSQGYGSFVMPAILILIIQQTVLMACGMAWGKVSQYKARRLMLYAHCGRRRSAVGLVLGRSLYYFLSNIFTWAVVVAGIFPLFDLVDNGQVVELMIFIVPYVLSSAFIGVFISSFFKQSESSLLYIFFTSIPFLFLSGISWPVDGMPEFLVWLSWLIPSTSAIEGYVALESVGASFEDVLNQWNTLWVLTLVGFVAATWRYSIIKTK